jgi:hypothetical protein
MNENEYLERGVYQIPSTKNLGNSDEGRLRKHVGFLINPLRPNLL